MLALTLVSQCFDLPLAGENHFLVSASIEWVRFPENSHILSAFKDQPVAADLLLTQEFPKLQMNKVHIIITLVVHKNCFHSSSVILLQSVACEYFFMCFPTALLFFFLLLIASLIMFVWNESFLCFPLRGLHKSGCLFRKMRHRVTENKMWLINRTSVIMYADTQMCKKKKKKQTLKTTHLS